MEEKISFRPVDNLTHDIPASLVVFLVALPLCLGIALASGAPLFSGLVAGITGGIVGGFLSRSPISVAGPAAGLTSIVIASIAELGSFPMFLACVVIAGLIQITFGFLKAGTIGHFFPVAVVKGMLAAIGLILILKQIPHAFGYDADFEGDEEFFQKDGHNTFSEILYSVSNPTLGAIVICGLSLLVLYFLSTDRAKKMQALKFLPAPLIVVAMGIGLNVLFNSALPFLVIQKGHLVNLPDFTSIWDKSLWILPDVNALSNPATYRIAATLALVASLETLLSLEAADKLDPLKRVTPLNRELKSQGVSNVVSGLLGGLPLTAVIVRTSANVQAGARTRTSTIVHGILLALMVFLLPGVLEAIPLASLAAILLMVGYKLTTPAIYKEMFRKGKDQFLPFVVTVVAILFTDLLVGIFIGILVSIFFVLKTNFRSAILLVNNNDQYLLRFTKDVSFLHKSSLRNALDSIPGRSTLMIDGSKSQFLDADIVETLQDFIKSSATKKIKVELKKTNDAINPLFRIDNGPLKRNGAHHTTATLHGSTPNH
jgi:MFS superfamily sulfate permease-like transporter